MATLPSSSSTLTSKLRSFISPTTKNNQTQLQLQSSFKTHLQFPLFSPSISLKLEQNPGKRNGLFVTKMGAYNVQVFVEENEPEDRLLNRFRREVMRANVIQECKRRRFFENSQEYRKRKTREAAKKSLIWRPRPRVVKQDNVEIPKNKSSYDSDEVDWDLPKGNLPY